MKSKFVFLCALFLAFLGLQAQVDRTNFRAGINVGLVVGDFSEAYSLKFDNVQFIPIAGSLRIYPTSGFKIGGDVGYAVGVNKGNEGGFYYRPTIGFDISGGTTEINVSYFAVNDEVTFSSALLGVLFLF